MPACESFPPIEGSEARVLVLGSMPGVASLDAVRYYAHPRNAFWTILSSLFERLDGIAPDPQGLRPQGPNLQRVELRLPEDLPSYPVRIRTLQEHGIALWDVLASCERDGSLDSSICRVSERGNDIPAFCRRHPELSLIAFNGLAAEKLFKRHIAKAVHLEQPALRFATLPSTSPAHASMPLAEKHERWLTALTSALSSS